MCRIEIWEVRKGKGCCLGKDSQRWERGNDIGEVNRKGGQWGVGEGPESASRAC